jgi:hypothetical protein
MARLRAPSTPAQILPETVFVLDVSEDYVAALAASDWIRISEWRQLPGSLTQWIQAQDGLKIDNSPISNREALINAYLLVHGKNHKSPEEGEFMFTEDGPKSNMSGWLPVCCQR